MKPQNKKNQEAVDKLKDRSFIKKTKKKGVYAHGELGMKVRDNLIAFWHKCCKMDIPELQGLGEIKEELHEEDGIKEELQDEDGIKEELQDEDGIKEELQDEDGKKEESEGDDNGQKIHVDAHGNSQDYVDLYAKDVETETEYSVLELIAEQGIRTMDQLTKLSVKEVEDLILDSSIRAPATNNKLGNPYRKSPYYHATKSFETEAARRKCLVRFEESKVEQFVYRVHYIVESYPGHLKVQNLRIQIYKQNSELVSFPKAINEGIVSKAVACIIGKVYKFFELLGMCEKVRFKQQRERDAGCWVAEVECTGRWIECTKINLLEAELDPIEDVELLEAEPEPIEEKAARVEALKAAFQNNYRSVEAELERMSQEKAREMKADLESKGEYKLHLVRLQTFAIIKPNMVRMKTKIKTVSVSFILGPVICCLYEHSFDTRLGTDGKLLSVFRFPPLVAPYICFIIKNNMFKSVTDPITKFLEDAAISCKLVTQGTGIAQRLITSDEYGCPYAIFVKSKDLVRIRERDSNDEISVEVNDVGQLIMDLLNGECTWQDAYKKYAPENLSI